MLVYLSTKNMIFDKKRQLDNLIFSLLRCDSARVQKPATIRAQQMVQMFRTTLETLLAKKLEHNRRL